VNVAIQRGASVGMIFPDKGGLGTLLIPNTVALIRGGPNPEEAKRLIDYLLSREVEQRLAFSDSMQIPVRDGVERPPHVPAYRDIRAMEVDYGDIAKNLSRSAHFTRELFRR
jgi:iron(III) transport system substrate-binding protein